MVWKKVPDYLLRMIDDYLSDRWMIYERVCAAEEVRILELRIDESLWRAKRGMASRGLNMAHEKTDPMWSKVVSALRISFLSHVLFSDEANFANTGNVNGLNIHYWANENPWWMRTVPFQHPWSVNCWCGIVGDHVIGPYFFEVRLTGQVYANFLQTVLPQLMEDVPLHVRMNKWMQNDGAP